jgi:TrmH family RNA methyltransferase
MMRDKFEKDNQAILNMITSTSNNHIKLVRALQSRSHTRKVESAFVAEGVRLIEEAVNAQWPLAYILFDQTLSERGRAIIEEIQQANLCDVFEITPNLMTDISDTETPQGILAVLKQKPLPLPVHPTFLVLADQVRDPGNMGTLLRTAEAAGADGIILSPGTVDAFSPKVVRSAMGAHFHLPIHALPWEEIRPLVMGLPIFLASAEAGIPLWEADFKQPCVLLVGGEAFGATPMGENLATDRVTIPMAGRAESLNAAIAAGILIAEVLRQRYSPRKA